MEELPPFENWAREIGPELAKMTAICQQTSLADTNPVLLEEQLDEAIRLQSRANSILNAAEAYYRKAQATEMHLLRTTRSSLSVKEREIEMNGLTSGYRRLRDEAGSRSRELHDRIISLLSLRKSHISENV